MSDFSTLLTKALLENEPIEEVFRKALEDAVNSLLQIELKEFLGYEKYSSDGWNSGNSRNGFYERSFDTRYGKLNLKIPRDRNNHFSQHLIPEYQRRSDDLETMIVQLYKKGITTREITDLIEKMYGHHYTPATVSNIAKSTCDLVDQFHKRNISNRYAVIYCDATCLNLRRDTVEKEALHVLLGIRPDGIKEVIDYALYPTEGATNYKDMLLNLKDRGLEEVLLFVSDGLTGIREALLSVFPKAKHQSCWVHVARNIEKKVRRRDRSEVLNDLKQVYTQESAEKAAEKLEWFLEKHKKSYPSLQPAFAVRESLFAFYSFPKEIRSSIYTSNLIENRNKGLKHKTKVKEQFPNQESLERFICMDFLEYNQSMSSKAHRGFASASMEINQLFEASNSECEAKPVEAA